jgi:hypothetical protein
VFFIVAQESPRLHPPARAIQAGRFSFLLRLVSAIVAGAASYLIDWWSPSGTFPPLEHCSRRTPCVHPFGSHLAPVKQNRTLPNLSCAFLKAQDSGFVSAVFFGITPDSCNFTSKSLNFLFLRPLPPNCFDNKHFHSLGKPLEGS